MASCWKVAKKLSGQMQSCTRFDPLGSLYWSINLISFLSIHYFPLYVRSLLRPFQKALETNSLDLWLQERIFLIYLRWVAGFWVNGSFLVMWWFLSYSTLAQLDDVIDLVIPRGSNKLVSQIKESTKIPVLGHSGKKNIGPFDSLQMEFVKWSFNCILFFLYRWNLSCLCWQIS